MIVDSHCHIYDDKLRNLKLEILENIKNNSQICVCSSDNLLDSKKSVELANENENIYATVGVHPHDVKEYSKFVEDELINLCKNKKVVAIGEIGLDYYYDYDFKELQFEVLKKQIILAHKLGLPCVFHIREAMGDFLKIADEMAQYFNNSAVMHSFNGSVEVAKILLKKGFYISFNGIITFKNANKLLDVVKFVPLDKILIETDSPYLTPVPFRGQVNRPEYVEYVAKKIAEIKGISLQEVIDATTQNAFDVYRIKDR